MKVSTGLRNYVMCYVPSKCDYKAWSIRLYRSVKFYALPFELN